MGLTAMARIRERRRYLPPEIVDDKMRTRLGDEAQQGTAWLEANPSRARRKGRDSNDHAKLNSKWPYERRP
jgi:hypothetical protein